ncbi:hypothetical protein DM02DRAFT_654999 [Periconia macrospinosa]|uniref:Geranylgeranyl pyrophosphate synthetase n=1 Tax=Periconia macrospinosa TaxID=97972 RepID=A0A2V1DVM2_9PLEO|nr:hypothetical protein DM02DRAFT_654999 [Periconia macrospinosa]
MDWKSLEGWRFGWPGPDTSYAPRPEHWMRYGCGKLISEIDQTIVEPAEVEVTSEAGYELLCSYNWQDDEEQASIIVPGGPPKWTPPPLPTQVRSDKGGFHYMDQNEYRAPGWTFEPVFQALSYMQPQMRLNNVDVIVNGNSLRRLLDFEVRGNFEKVSTKYQPGLECSSGHHRVIRYQLGDLNCAVRFECDAYLDDGNKTAAEAFFPSDAVVTPHSHPSQASNNSNTSPPIPQTAYQALPSHRTEEEQDDEERIKVIIGGGQVDSSSKLVEIKTSGIRKKVTPGHHVAQLWFGRTSYLCEAKHDYGNFQKISCTDMKDRFKEWENRHQDSLRKLVTLLTELKGVVSTTAYEAAVLVCENHEPIRIYESNEPMEILPQPLKAKFWGATTKNESWEEEDMDF